MSYPLGAVQPDQRTEFYADPGDEGSRSRFRGLATGLIALLVVGLFAAATWFAYVQGTRHGSGTGAEEVPLIRADTRPTKVKPEKPGGMEIPDRDKLIYTQKRAAVEHLLPPPEKPMSRPTTPGISAPQAESPQLAAGSGSGAAVTATSSAAPTANPPGKTAVKSTPAAKPASAQPSPAKASGARIQLASVRSEEAALHEWDRIRRTNSDLLGNLSATPVRVDLGEKGVFYRVLSGPVADAERLCRELNQRNLGCIVAR
jgi:SPOR domain